jgi:glycosyltransferase involved in cell wall biosynthesis
MAENAPSNALPGAARRLRVLHVLAEIRESAMAYNEFVAGMAGRLDLSVVSLHQAMAIAPKGVDIFEGDGTLLGLFRALREAMRRDYDVYHVHFANVSAPFLLKVFWRREVMRRTIFTFHTSYGNLTLRNRILFFFVLCLFRRIVCCSHSSMESVPPLLRKLAGERLTFIRNGVDIGRIDEVRRNARRDGGGKSLIAACRLIKVKDLPTTLEALHLCDSPELKLEIVGEGPERAALERFSAGAGIAKQVEYAGSVSRDEVYERMSASGAFVSTSLGEGLPLAVMEAMACGLPVILSDIPPHREIVGDAFPLVTPGDAKGFAREILRLFGLPEERRRAIGAKGRKIVEAGFSLGRMQAEYERIYFELAP